MRRDNCIPLIVAVALALCLASWVYAREISCAYCGHCGSCRKICRLVCEDKKVEIVCWGSQCEDFCLPCHGKPGCEHCEMVCGECSSDPEKPYAKAMKFVWREWFPTKATMHTRVKLMKKTITKEVPSYKWVVEELCPHCENRCEFASVSSEAELPPVPVADAVVKYGTAVASAEDEIIRK